MRSGVYPQLSRQLGPTQQGRRSETGLSSYRLDEWFEPGIGQRVCCFGLVARVAALTSLLSGRIPANRVYPQRNQRIMSNDLCCGRLPQNRLGLCVLAGFDVLFAKDYPELPDERWTCRRRDQDAWIVSTGMPT